MRSLFLLLLLLLLLASPAHAQVTQIIRPIIADVNGGKIGTVVTVGVNTAIIEYIADTTRVLLSVVGPDFVVNADGAFPPIVGNGDALVYQSTDCSGTPMLLVNTRSLAGPSFVGAPGMTVYVADPVGQPVSGVWDSARGAGACSVRLDHPVGLLVSAMPLVNLLDTFTLPISLTCP